MNQFIKSKVTSIRFALVKWLLGDDLITYIQVNTKLKGILFPDNTAYTLQWEGGVVANVIFLGLRKSLYTVKGVIKTDV